MVEVGLALPIDGALGSRKCFAALLTEIALGAGFGLSHQSITIGIASYGFFVIGAMLVSAGWLWVRINVLAPPNCFLIDPQV
jgi:hypothetical protein